MERVAVIERQALVRRLEDRKWFEAVPGEQITIRVRSEEVAGAYAVVEGILSPSSGPPLHTHENEDEIIEVFDGSLPVVCNGAEFEAATGVLVIIPRGTPHTWRNDTNRPVWARATLTPGGAEGMFEAFAGRPPEELEAIAKRYGCRFVGPPLRGPQGAGSPES
jgi:quercetin dioxygenase-like cupin family protein